MSYFHVEKTLEVDIGTIEAGSIVSFDITRQDLRTSNLIFIINSYLDSRFQETS